MIKLSPKYNKLKTALQLASNRSRILQSKQLELTERIKVDIINCIKKERYVQAKIKAHRIINDEASIEALGFIEMYCELLLERYDLFEQMRDPDSSLLIPISNLIWVTPYYKTYIKELKIIMKELVAKCGNRFCRMALKNENGNVNPELKEKVGLFMPSNERIENYLNTLCLKYGVAYKWNAQGISKDKNSDFQNTSRLSSKCSNRGEITEFKATGSNKVDNTLSSKKAFMMMLKKFKRKQKSHDNTDMKNNNTSCNDIVPYYNVKAISNNDGNKLNQQTRRKLLPPTAESNVKTDSTSNQARSAIREKTTENEDLRASGFKFNAQRTNDINSDIYCLRSQAFINRYDSLYFDPPPPYNYQHIQMNNVTGPEYRNNSSIFQTPTCPDTLDSVSPTCPCTESKKRQEK